MGINLGLLKLNHHRIACAGRGLDSVKPNGLARPLDSVTIICGVYDDTLFSNSDTLSPGLASSILSTSLAWGTLSKVISVE